LPWKKKHENKKKKKAPEVKKRGSKLRTRQRRKGNLFKSTQHLVKVMPKAGGGGGGKMSFLRNTSEGKVRGKNSKTPKGMQKKLNWEK